MSTESEELLMLKNIHEDEPEQDSAETGAYENHENHDDPHSNRGCRFCREGLRWPA